MPLSMSSMTSFYLLERLLRWPASPAAAPGVMPSLRRQRHGSSVDPFVGDRSLPGTRLTPAVDRSAPVSRRGPDRESIEGVEVVAHIGNGGARAGSRHGSRRCASSSARSTLRGRLRHLRVELTMIVLASHRRPAGTTRPGLRRQRRPRARRSSNARAPPLSASATSVVLSPLSPKVLSCMRVKVIARCIRMDRMMWRCGQRLTPRVSALTEQVREGGRDVGMHCRQVRIHWPESRSGTPSDPDATRHHLAGPGASEQVSPSFTQPVSTKPLGRSVKAQCAPSSFIP